MELMLTGLALIGMVGWLATVVRGDGLGHRPAPAGRRHWAEGTTVAPLR